MFYASSFGVKSPALDSDWVLVNGLAGVGYTATNDIVNGAGTAGYPVWKWINLSEFAGNVSFFTVSTGRLTQTFQIGARENGLDMDKFAFVTAGTAFTVANWTTEFSNGSPTNKFTGPDGIAFHRFSPLVNGINADAANPATALVLSDGVLLGTTLNGGSQGAGTAFYMTLDGTNFSAFRSFANTPDAANPAGNLTVFGQRFFWNKPGRRKPGCGRGFFGEYQRQRFILQNFAAVSADEATNAGGASPDALLALSGSVLFIKLHRRWRGGQRHCVFVVHEWFAIFCPARFQRVGLQHRHQCRRRASVRRFDLSGATLYGTASAGGSGGAGVVFSVNVNGSNFTTLHSFTPLDPLTATNADGAFPASGLVLSNGMLYGTTYAGGCGGRGTVFSIQTNGVDFVVLHTFSAIDPVTGTNSDGASPCAALALSGSNVYGTAAAGGAGAAGTVFSVSTNGTQFQIIHAFPPWIRPPAQTSTVHCRWPECCRWEIHSTAPHSAAVPAGWERSSTWRIPYPPAVITGIARIQTAVQRCISSAAPIPPTSFKPPSV